MLWLHHGNPVSRNWQPMEHLHCLGGDNTSASISIGTLSPAPPNKKRSSQRCVLLHEVTAFWNWDWRAFEGKKVCKDCFQFVRWLEILGRNVKEQDEPSWPGLPETLQGTSLWRGLRSPGSWSMWVRSAALGSCFLSKKLGEEYIKVPPLLKKQIIVMKNTIVNPSSGEDETGGSLGLPDQPTWTVRDPVWKRT